MPKFSALTVAFVLLISLSSLTSFAQAVTSPRPASPAATISQTVGISTVTVSYSRPAVKGREIWGTLVPYGWNVQAFGAGNEAPWRAGANENTVIRFSHPAMVEGQAVPAGSYGLFFVINKDNSGELILSKEFRSWGSFFYDPKQDFMRVKIQLRDVPQTEVLTYNFSNATRTSAELALDWEKKEFPVKIEFAVDDIVIANATQELKGPTGFNWLGYFSAANYILQNKVNLEQGMAWIDKAIIMNNSFLTLNVKSGILKEMGKNTEADNVMNDAVNVSTEAELNQYADQMLTAKQQDKAIELFVLNAQRHPKSPNVWDSLGEGYALKGDKKNAVASFKKSLSMNPPANVKENSEKYLKKLGAM